MSKEKPSREERDNFVRYLRLYLQNGITSPKRFLRLILLSGFFFLFVAAILSFAFLGGFGIYQVLSSFKDISEVIHGIELLFVSPLPLIIVFAFFSYFRRLIEVELTSETDPPDQVEFLKELKETALGEVTTSKYLFVSLLLSTLFVNLMKMIFDLGKGEIDVKGVIIRTSLSTILIIMLMIYLRFFSKHGR